MKGFNLHDVELKEIVVKGEVEQSYHQFLDCLKSKNKKATFENVFLAGYMLANPTLRDKFKLYREKEIDKNLHFN